MSDRREFHDLADPEEAAATVRSLALDPASERVPLTEARDRVLLERVDAAIDVPGFDRASMDGYAVAARDTFGADEADPAVLDVVGAVHAGDAPDVAVDEGTAVEISTGAVLPDGADAVVMVERTNREDGTVLVRTSVAPGDHVMTAGTDVAAGERVLGPETRLSAREVGLLSALGVDEVAVRGRPRVGVVSTGDELVRPGGELDHRRGQIHDVNSYAIAAAVEEAGGDPVVYPHAGGAATTASPVRAGRPVGDDRDELERVLLDAAEECDLVLSSGSTSASAVDVIYRVIEERGELYHHGVAVKPGKPMLVGTLGEAAYVGLPGYPVSALTIFRTFVAPAVREAAGLPEPRTATVEGTMATAERYAEGRRRLLPVGLVEDGERNTLVYPVDKGSGATTSLVEADGVVEVPADTAYLAAGERVTVDLFSADVRPPSLLGVGEDDPALSRLLDRSSNPRYLSVGTREGLRRLRDGIPDLCIAAGPIDREVRVERRSGDAGRPERLGGWTRECGLIVPGGNPTGVAGLADLADRDLRLVNRGRDSGLRTSLDEALADLADDRGTDRADLVAAIDGYERTVRAHESPARRVAAGEADAGLGLGATAERLDLGFVPVGEERVRVLAHPDRLDKPGVAAFSAALDAHLDDAVDGLAGYRID